MELRVILFGATGMVGEGVLRTVIEDDNVQSVLVIGRRPCNIQHPKLSEIIHQDFFNITALAERFRGWNVCLFCLGVTSVGKGEAEYRRLTYDLTMGAAKVLSDSNPDMTFCYVSGAGTDSSGSSRMMWARVKGETENSLAKLPFKAVYSFRPGFIKPLDGQSNAYTFARALGMMYPLLKACFPGSVCTMKDLGLAMIRAAKIGYTKTILENRDIADLAKLSSGNVA